MGLRVLVIDDNDAFRAAVRQLLERSGLVVVAEAADGAAGVTAALAHTPDLAIVDVQLPGDDGFAVAEKLAALAPAPTVILTSSLDPADFGALLDHSPAIGFIAKAALSGRTIEALINSSRRSDAGLADRA